MFIFLSNNNAPFLRTKRALRQFCSTHPNYLTRTSLPIVSAFLIRWTENARGVWKLVLDGFANTRRLGIRMLTDWFTVRVETSTVNVPDRMHEWMSEVGTTETYLADNRESFIPRVIWRQSASWKVRLYVSWLRTSVEASLRSTSSSRLHVIFRENRGISVCIRQRFYN